MLPQKVTVCEVGPRDGFQLEKKFIDTKDKVDIINQLSEAGLPRIEINSFVSPKVVPQMADAAEVAGLVKKYPDTVYSSLALNLKGVQRVIDAQIKEIHMVVVASDTYNLKNAKMTTEANINNFKVAAEEVKRNNIDMWGTVGTAFGCPYEGEMPEERVMSIANELINMGASVVNLADTTGMANPRQVYELCTKFKKRWPEVPLALHFHNTRGAGLANVMAGLEAGVTLFESSIGGMGGCPFAPRAVGNICTEDLVHMLWGMGIETGIDLEKLINVSKNVEKIIGYELPGQVMKSGIVGFRKEYA